MTVEEVKVLAATIEYVFANEEKVSPQTVANFLRQLAKINTNE